MLWTRRATVSFSNATRLSSFSFAIVAWQSIHLLQTHTKPNIHVYIQLSQLEIATHMVLFELLLDHGVLRICLNHVHLVAEMLLGVEQLTDDSVLIALLSLVGQLLDARLVSALLQILQSSVCECNVNLD
jgi:hypothetical protein